jgi:ABC-2 family transporter
VRMQYDYFHDAAGLAGSVSKAAPRWLRLTRSGDTITGYDSADGTHWAKVGTATLAGLPVTAQAGLFATSPIEFAGRQAFANDSVAELPTWAIGAFDHVSLNSPGARWAGTDVGAGRGQAPPPAHCQNTGSGHVKCTIKPGASLQNSGYRKSAGTFTVTGSGDIAPYVPTVDPLEVAFKASLIGLVAMIAIGVLFVTSEYRRGLIRTTFAASPRRGRVLLAKAIVAGSVTFVAGAVAAAVAFPITESKLRSNGWLTSVHPVNSLISGTGLRVVLGTAALLAIGTIFALAVGSVLRRSAGAISAGIVLLVFPLILATVLPQAPADWLLRLTPAAAFGVQTTTPRYPQVITSCLPYHGCYPLAPWTGVAVLGVWAAIAMAGAVYLLRRRDA